MMSGSKAPDLDAGLPNQGIPAIIIAKEGTASTGGKTDMYTFDSRVRYSETGEDGLLSLPAIVDYFQDASTFHRYRSWNDRSGWYGSSLPPQARPSY